MFFLPFAFYYCRPQKVRKEMRLMLESPNASLKWLREFCWNPSKQKPHLEEGKKKKEEKILLLSL